MYISAASATLGALPVLGLHIEYAIRKYPRTEETYLSQ